MSRTWNKRTCDDLSPDVDSLIGCPLNVLKQSIACWWDGVKPTGLSSKQLLSGFVNSQAATHSIIQLNNISLKDLHPVILYRSRGAGQGDENRYNLREAVFLDFPKRQDTVSHPLNAWKAGKASVFFSPRELAIS